MDSHHILFLKFVFRKGQFISANLRLFSLVMNSHEHKILILSVKSATCCSKIIIPNPENAKEDAKGGLCTSLVEL